MRRSWLPPLFGVTGLLGFYVLAYHPGWPAPTATLPADLPRDFVWGITWHPDDLRATGHDLAPQQRALDDLGVGLERFDVRWSELEPQEGAFRRDDLPFFHEVVARARAHGRQVKVNLGSYPPWAIAKLHHDPEGFFAAYRHYLEEVIPALGTGVDYFQLGNEFNTVLDPIPAEWDGRVFREAHAVLAPLRRAHPGWHVKTVINACDSFHLPWKHLLERALDEASDSIDVIGYDFYPGNYSQLADWGAWSSIRYLSELMRRYDKDGAICETGCLAFFGEARQARWVAESPRAMLRAIARSPMRARFRFAAFYELGDAPRLPLLMPHTEATFGLMTAEGRRKAGFEAFRQVVAQTRALQAAERQASQPSP